MSPSELTRLLWPAPPADAAVVVVVEAADVNDAAATIGVDEGLDDRLIAVTSEDPSMQSRFDSSWRIKRASFN